MKRLNINDGAEVIERFAIEKNETCATLDHWLEASSVLTATEKELLNEIRRDILILGRDWNFTTLIGKSYCVSRLYDATNVDDLHQIVFILRRLKDLILNR